MNTVNVITIEKKEGFINHIDRLKEMIKHQTIPIHQKNEISLMKASEIILMLENIEKERDKYERYIKIQPLIEQELKNAKSESDYSNIRNKYSEFFVSDSTFKNRE